MFDAFERTRRYRGTGGPSAAQAFFADDQPYYCDGRPPSGSVRLCFDRAGPNLASDEHLVIRGLHQLLELV